MYLGTQVAVRGTMMIFVFLLSLGVKHISGRSARRPVKLDAG